MAARPLNRARIRERVRREGDVIDLRDHDDPPRSRDVGNVAASPDPRKLDGPGQLRETRFFGSPAFRRLWFSQLLSSLGDWIGIFAITAIAYRVGGSLAMGAPALVIAARIIPGLFASPFAGVLLDRWDRKRIMVISDIGRAVVLCFLPFVNTLAGLFIASLILELFTLMWSPAKEATVPNLVRKDFLPTANSLSLAAAYGTIVPGTALLGVLASVPGWLGQSETLSNLHLTKESLALYFDALTYVLSAMVIATLAIPDRRTKEARTESNSASQSIAEAREGWRFVAVTPRVRGVVVGMATGLIGGGMAVTLGVGFADQVLSAGTGGYSALMTAMGVGAAVGVLAVSVVQKRLPLDRSFVAAAFGASAAMAGAAAMHGLVAAALLIAVMGMFAGALYVLSFTMLQLSVDDDLRGRVFATFYTVTRLAILVGLIAGPVVSVSLDALSDRWFDRSLDVGGVSFFLPGVRLTLWLGAIIIAIAGFIALRSLRGRAAEAS